MTDDKNLDYLGVKFYEDFSRTEYALKGAGYIRGTSNAQADWESFSVEPEVEKLIANPSTSTLKEAINFILIAPPMKQVGFDKVPLWEVSEPITNSTSNKLLIYIRRIRNNLFHGAKFNEHWFKPERSEPLLRHSLVILSAVREGVPKVKEVYEG